uniref:Prolactin n=1 Tax=Anguilla japonica TaxID=7937 RepID=PRL_ANGJA|nr:RecName: Full=Prolactin; Short=PRL; Flags: Precursor [Anguilla japonica]AAO17792.1 prolactin precursor [Anguilla japonica]WRH19160.1 prolactin [Anguilla japonica]
MAQRFKGSNLFLTALLCLASQGHAVGLGDMLERASQLSDKLHSLSTSLTNDLDTHFPPMGKILMPRPSMCHTASLQTPHDKDQALRVPESELLSLARALLLSWNDPLLLLTSEAPTLSHPQNGVIYSKTRELQDQSNSLSSGLDRLIHKIGSSSKSLSPLPFQGGDLGSDKNSRLINFYFLLSCFRRDSHKIDNFLKLLRCRAAKQDRC